MSARGAEGILKRQGKIPAAPPPLAKEPVEEATETPPPDTDAQAEKKQRERTKRAEKAGKQVGTYVGRQVGKGISVSNEAGGFILALLLWGWIVRPYLANGVPGVKAMLMAKFFNKKPDGTELP